MFIVIYRNNWWSGGSYGQDWRVFDQQNPAGP